MAFYKKNSYAKHINELSFTIKINNNTAHIKNKNLKKTINGLPSFYSENKNINQYKQELYLIENCISTIFNEVKSDFHKYINIKIQCQNIYINNLLNEWILKWANTDFYNVPNNDRISNIFSYINKCKILVE
jgi:dihydroneopterin aldolase